MSPVGMTGPAAPRPDPKQVNRAASVSVRRLLESFESFGFDGAHDDAGRGLHCGRTRIGRSTTAIT
jgi:hypothetical protein